MKHYSSKVKIKTILNLNIILLYKIHLKVKIALASYAMKQ